MSRLCDLAVEDFLQAVDASTLFVQNVHEMHPGQIGVSLQMHRTKKPTYFAISFILFNLANNIHRSASERL